jgi:hypothetical protein
VSGVSVSADGTGPTHVGQAGEPAVCSRHSLPPPTTPAVVAPKREGNVEDDCSPNPTKKRNAATRNGGMDIRCVALPCVSSALVIHLASALLPSTRARRTAASCYSRERQHSLSLSVCVSLCVVCGVCGRSTMFTPAGKRQTTAAAAAASVPASPGANSLRMAWVRLKLKADKAEGAPVARWG